MNAAPRIRQLPPPAGDPLGRQQEQRHDEARRLVDALDPSDGCAEAVARVLVDAISAGDLRSIRALATGLRRAGDSDAGLRQRGLLDVAQLALERLVDAVEIDAVRDTAHAERLLRLLAEEGGMPETDLLARLDIEADDMHAAADLLLASRLAVRRRGHTITLWEPTPRTPLFLAHLDPAAPR
jgi:hypothetical protein